MSSRRFRQGLGINRRDVLRVLWGAPALALAHTGLAAAASVAKTSWKPRFLHPRDVETVASLSDCILSRTEKKSAYRPDMHEYIDASLARSEPSVRASFNDGLAWLDAYAERTAGRRFVELDRASQHRLLAEISDTSRAHEPTGYAFLTQIKQLTIEGYYRPASAPLT